MFATAVDPLRELIPKASLSPGVRRPLGLLLDPSMKPTHLHAGTVLV